MATQAQILGNRRNALKSTGPQTSPRLLISRMKALYRPRNDRYYTRCMCRCSSTVEHGFRKAGVEGSSPSIGCYVLTGRVTHKVVCGKYI